jgi:hypothetical protein
MAKVIGVVGQQRGLEKLDEVAEYYTRGGESPVVENWNSLAESRVAWST